ncbi:MAG: DUF1579 family protein [Pseudomonadota bacterium]
MSRKIVTLALLLAAPSMSSVWADQATLSPEDIMERHIKASQIGEQQQSLAEMAGVWDVTTTLLFDPNNPETVKGESTRTMTLEGRVLEEQFSSTMMGQPMNGIGRTGYDNVTGRWWSTWTDNVSTGVSVFYGRIEGETMIFEGETPDPITGQMSPMRLETQTVSPDKEVSVFFSPGPDGQMIQTMEMVYERR